MKLHTVMEKFHLFVYVKMREEPHVWTLGLMFSANQPAVQILKCYFVYYFFNLSENFCLIFKYSYFLVYNRLCNF